MNPPSLIARRYQIDQPIAEGGMGTVYRGTDTRSGQPVAIKQLKPDVLVDNPQAIERFRREVEALRRLNHPNIVRLLGTAREGRAYYIIMEYVPGGSLETLLQQTPQLSVEQILHLALDLCDALTRAHRLNIIHRDLKPSNVLLMADGTPRLTDFGIARMSDMTRLTRPDSAMGTPLYMSPEACRGVNVDARADIWALGMMLHEMLAGRHPFANSRETPATLFTAILMEPVPALHRLRPDLPPALSALIDRMLAKDPDQRIRSIRQVAAQIDMILHGEDPASAHVSGPADAPDDLVNGLLGLVEGWENKARDATSSAAKVRMDANRAAYFKALAEAYKAAAQEVLDLIYAEPEPEGGQQIFVPVTLRQVEQFLGRAGMKAMAIYEDTGSIFSVVFTKMPPISPEERMVRLRAACSTIVFLDSGKLHDTGEPYLDFGFTAPP